MQQIKDVDVRLKGVSIKNHWGCNSSSLKRDCIFTFRDNEVIYTIGNKLALYDYGEEKTKLINLQFIETQSILLLTLSIDLKFLALAVRLTGGIDRKVFFLMYDIESLLTSQKKPISIEYAPNKNYEDIIITCMSFSNDSSLFGISSSFTEAGILIYDRLTGVQLFHIATTDLVLKLTFNPSDNTRLCVTGENNLFQYWRCNNKTIHPIPIHGLKKGSSIYTTHVWYQDTKVVAGTETGYLALVQGSEQQLSHSAIYAFGGPHQPGHESCGVASILVRQDILVISSSIDCIAIFDIRAQPVTQGSSDSSLLHCLARIKFSNFNDITGLQWCFGSTSSSYDVFISTVDGLYITDLKAPEYRVEETNAAVAQLLSGTTSHGPPLLSQITGENDEQQNGKTSKAYMTHKGGASGGNDSPLAPRNRRASIATSNYEATNNVDWIYLSPDRTILQYHAGRISNMAISSRTSGFITCGDDNTIRLWNFASCHNPCLYMEKFDPKTSGEIPRCISLHPSGLMAVFGCDSDIREVSLTDSKFDVTRKIPTKIPFTTASGMPFANTVSVSLVKYSHGGQLVAVVTGRLAQVFHMYNLEYSATEPSGK
jgi:WD40 repeat protein